VAAVTGPAALRPGDLCLVTGGAGFIGSNLTAALVRRGMRVRVFDDLSTGRLANLEGSVGPLEIVEGDVRDAEGVLAATRGCAAVFHQAAIPSVARSVADPVTTNDVNVGGTLNVLMAARDSGVGRVVFASSSSVYGNAPVQPAHEDLPCRPISPYGVSKLAGERYLQAFWESYGLPTVALRYFNVFGTRQDPRAEYAAVVPRFVEAAVEGSPATIFGDGRQVRDFTFVDDVVQANLRAADAPPDAWGRAFNVARGERHSVNELLAEVQAAAGVVRVPAVHEPARAGDVRQSHAAIEAARRVLGYVPESDLGDGIRRTVDWYRQQRTLGLL
jgi:UDP-N-acetylglucosamine/UDP-N-acetyl-alpha-D-glucosaminouronate 4-epimerase